MHSPPFPLSHLGHWRWTGYLLAGDQSITDHIEIKKRSWGYENIEYLYFSQDYNPLTSSRLLIRLNMFMIDFSISETTLFNLRIWTLKSTVQIETMLSCNWQITHRNNNIWKPKPFKLQSLDSSIGTLRCISIKRKLSVIDREVGN